LISQAKDGFGIAAARHGHARFHKRGNFAPVWDFGGTETIRRRLTGSYRSGTADFLENS